MIWLSFSLCAVCILFAGMRLAKDADVIAEKTGLGQIWIGVILLAVATSLPELFTGVGSVMFVDAPDITVGNILGANSYNLLNIGVLDALHRGYPLLRSLSSGQLLTAAFSLIPLLFLTLAMVLAANGITVVSVGNVGMFSIGIFLACIVLLRVLYGYEKRTRSQASSREEVRRSGAKYGDVSLRKAYLSCAAAALVIVISGIWLAFIGKELSAVYRLDQSFVGNLLIGFVTTLPEMVVSLTALLIGAQEMAVANMLGSNLFNLSIIFVDDLLYRRSAILQTVSPNHVWSASVVMVMTAVVILAMTVKTEKKILGINWYVPVLFVIFLAGAYYNYTMGAP